MTQEEFIEVLDSEGYSHEIDGDKLIVKKDANPDKSSHPIYVRSIPSNVVFKNGGDLSLPYLTSIPKGVEFWNSGSIYLLILESIPSDVKFNNDGAIWMESLLAIPSGFVFNNKGGIFLVNIRSIPNDVIFNTGRGVYINSFTDLKNWRGDSIEGIDDRKIINLLLKRGMFI